MWPSAVPSLLKPRLSSGLLQASFVTFSNSLCLSMPQFLICEMGGSSTSLPHWVMMKINTYESRSSVISAVKIIELAAFEMGTPHRSAALHLILKVPLT